MKRWNKITLRKQILIFFGMILGILLCVCLPLYYRYIQNVMLNSEKEKLMSMCDLVKSNVSAVIDNADKYSQMAAYSDNVQSILENAQSNKETGTILSDIKLITSVSYVKSIYVLDNYGHVYSGANAYMNSIPDRNFKSTSWYQDMVKADGKYILRVDSGGFLEKLENEEDYISVIRIINDIYTIRPVGMIILNISLSQIEENFEVLNFDSGQSAYIVDKDNRIMTSSHNVAEETRTIVENMRDELWGENSQSFFWEKGKYYVSSIPFENSDFQIVILQKKLSFTQDIKQIMMITVVILVICLFLTYFGAVIITNRVNAPITRILESMENIENKQFTVIREISTNQEMNRLQKGYNQMVLKINELFEQVVIEQRMKRKYELDILHEQIKPHFLYNTFDSVGALALMNRSEDVFKIMQALGTYYRTSLHKGQEIITVEEELKIVYNYLIIQKYRYEDVFSVEYEIDKVVKTYKTLKLVLQPFVENAIYHGLKENGIGGIIKVKASKTDEYIVFHVIDDGAGMEQERLEQVLAGQETDKGKSFGVYGTIERIHLTYNRNDLVTIKSQKGKGTDIMIRIPIKE